MGSVQHSRQRYCAWLRQDRDGTRRRATVSAALDRRRANETVRDPGGDRPERGLPGKRRRVVHHGRGVGDRWRLHTALTAVAAGSRAVVFALAVGAPARRNRSDDLRRLAPRLLAPPAAAT